MAETTGEIGYIKQNIIDEISSNLDTVQEVADYEKVGFRGFPAVTVTCSGNENLFYSSAENERTFIFTLRVFEQIEQVPNLDSVSDNSKQRAENNLELVVDQILNTFDKTTRFTLEDTADNGIEAVPSRWGYALLPVGWCRTAEIEVRVKRTYLVS